MRPIRISFRRASCEARTSATRGRVDCARAQRLTRSTCAKTVRRSFARSSSSPISHLRGIWRRHLRPTGGGGGGGGGGDDGSGGTAAAIFRVLIVSEPGDGCNRGKACTVDPRRNSSAAEVEAAAVDTKCVTLITGWECAADGHNDGGKVWARVVQGCSIRGVDLAMEACARSARIAAATNVTIEDNNSMRLLIYDASADEYRPNVNRETARAAQKVQCRVVGNTASATTTQPTVPPRRIAGIFVQTHVPGSRDTCQKLMLRRTSSLCPHHEHILPILYRPRQIGSSEPPGAVRHPVNVTLPYVHHMAVLCDKTYNGGQ
jgi:hypothetical protein